MQIANRKIKKKTLIKQKLLGIATLGLCGAIIILASKGNTPTEKDASAILFLAPLGIYMLCTKEIVIN